jgi:hypothetical protein
MPTSNSGNQTNWVTESKSIRPGIARSSKFIGTVGLILIGLRVGILPLELKELVQNLLP